MACPADAAALAVADGGGGAPVINKPIKISQFISIVQTPLHTHPSRPRRN